MSSSNCECCERAKRLRYLPIPDFFQRVPMSGVDLTKKKMSDTLYNYERVVCGTAVSLRDRLDQLLEVMDSNQSHKRYAGYQFQDIENSAMSLIQFLFALRTVSDLESVINGSFLKGKDPTKIM